METTVILLKPDCVGRKLVGEVIRRFEAAGFTIRGAKMLAMTRELLREHYAHLVGEPFYPLLEAFMMSSPVMALAVAGDGAIDRARMLVGPTDSRKAAAGTIRGDLGTDNRRNIMHASDSPETAAKELIRFFHPGELFGD
jgi:nucleoside-diphosphate kinase